MIGKEVIRGRPKPQSPPPSQKTGGQKVSRTPSVVKKASEEQSPPKRPVFSINISGIRHFFLNFIVPIVCFGASLFLIIGFIYPYIKAKPDLEKELSDKQKLGNTLREKVSDLNRLTDYKSVMDENYDLINKVLVSEDLIPELLSQIDFIVRSSGLKITRLSSQGQKDSTKEGFFVTNVALSVSGSYEQFLAFVTSMENAARVVDVTDMRYTVDTAAAGILSFSITVSAPYYTVNERAVTDESIDLDVSNRDFLDFVDKMKELRYYDSNELSPVEEIIPEEDLEESESTESQEGALQEGASNEGTQQEGSSPIE